MPRTLPEITPENEAFWTGGREGRLMIAHCETCGDAIHPPQVVCPLCLSDRVTPRPALGTGTVEARTINRQAWSANMDAPFAIAAVALDGEPGVRVTARIVECDPEAVAIGDRVEVVFEEDRGVWVPMFRPIAKLRGAQSAADFDVIGAL